jgi:RNA polymerase sigma factor (sigma-70 family)
LLRLRSDEQLVALFRAGHEEAFRAIYDRYRQRLFAYTRQMLPGSRQDAEDALQDVFIRAYSGLRANDRDLALRAWLYRVAHNRCIDELRRPLPSIPDLAEMAKGRIRDPIAEAEQREALRRLIADVRRLPDQQRSALLMRELSGMSYAELAVVLGVSVAAVRSLLVRARLGLVRALEARETACSEIRRELVGAHDRGVRPTATARRHLRDCSGCREFRGRLKGTSRQLAALTPGIGPLGLTAKLLGIGGGAGGSAAAGGGAVGGVAATGGAIAAGTSHVATLLAAAVLTTGGALEIQHSAVAQSKRRVHPGATTAAGVRNAALTQSAVSDVGTPGSAVISVDPPPEGPPTLGQPTHGSSPGGAAVSTLPGTGGASSSSTTAPESTTGAVTGSATQTGTGSVTEVLTGKTPGAGPDPSGATRTAASSAGGSTGSAKPGGGGAGQSQVPTDSAGSSGGTSSGSSSAASSALSGSSPAATGSTSGPSGTGP